MGIRLVKIEMREKCHMFPHTFDMRYLRPSIVDTGFAADCRMGCHAILTKASIAQSTCHFRNVTAGPFVTLSSIMRSSRFVLQVLLNYAMLVSTSVVPRVPGHASRPQPMADLEERYVQSVSTILDLCPSRNKPPTNQLLNMPAPPPSVIADLPILPSSYSDPPINLTTNLTSAQTIQFRVPHSTIELHVTTTKSVAGQILGNALLAMHEWFNNEIASRGDSTLAIRGDDPFLWEPDGSPSRSRRLLKLHLGQSTLPVSLFAESAKGEHMTYGVLLIAVEGLYLCLPAVGRDYGAQFDIWDWRDQAMWGHGEVKGL